MKLKPLDHLHTLYNNPFLLEPVFPAFFGELSDVKDGILLSYIVLPLVLPQHTRQALRNLKSTSNIATFTSPTNGRSRLLGLGVRVAECKVLTGACLQYNMELGQLILADNLSLRPNPIRPVAKDGSCPEDIVLAAKKLGRIVGGHTIPHVFMHFGIANL